MTLRVETYNKTHFYMDLLIRKLFPCLLRFSHWFSIDLALKFGMHTDFFSQTTVPWNYYNGATEVECTFAECTCVERTIAEVHVCRTHVCRMHVLGIDSLQNCVSAVSPLYLKFRLSILFRPEIEQTLKPGMHRSWRCALARSDQI